MVNLKLSMLMNYQKTDLGGIKRDIEALTKLVKDQNKRNIDFVNKLKEAYKHE